jgi:hypothetical protein
MLRLIMAAAAALALITGSLLGAGTAGATGDPYSSDGMWLVPSEIAPGTYRAAIKPNMFDSGYYAVCADYACEPGPGMISNDYMIGPGIVVIPPSAVSVELNNLSLTRMP